MNPALKGLKWQMTIAWAYNKQIVIALVWMLI